MYGRTVKNMQGTPHHIEYVSKSQLDHYRKKESCCYFNNGRCENIDCHNGLLKCSSPQLCVHFRSRYFKSDYYEDKPAKSIDIKLNKNTKKQNKNQSFKIEEKEKIDVASSNESPYNLIVAKNSKKDTDNCLTKRNKKQTFFVGKKAYLRTNNGTILEGIVDEILESKDRIIVNFNGKKSVFKISVITENQALKPYNKFCKD